MHFFRDQHGIQGSASKQLISRNKKFQTVVAKRDRLSNAAYLDVIFSRCSQRHGILQLFRIVNKSISLNPSHIHVRFVRGSDELASYSSEAAHKMLQANALLKEADAALYRAKRAGRNTVSD